ncbi:MAG TPA: hypothetical protein VH331_05385 [Allosphingosinicella sp.]|nr:hypothetical protein [Allosphingosinicella sp.]
MSAASAAILLAAVPAAAFQDAWAQQVKSYMDRAAKPFFDRGYHYGGFFYLGSLKNGASERLSVKLGSGMRTQLMGGCDTDCSNLDLVLYDAAGNRVDQDVQADDYPIVTTVPPVDATYTLEVRMVKCAAEPCRYAVQQYVK